MAEEIDSQLDQALATIDRIAKAGSQIDKTSIQTFEDIAKRYSLERSQTVAGVIGASAGATAGIVCPHFSRLDSWPSSGRLVWSSGLELLFLRGEESGIKKMNEALTRSEITSKF
jgi:hypothetical protein